MTPTGLFFPWMLIRYLSEMFSWGESESEGRGDVRETEIRFKTFIKG